MKNVLIDYDSWIDFWEKWARKTKSLFVDTAAKEQLGYAIDRSKLSKNTRITSGAELRKNLLHYSAANAIILKITLSLIVMKTTSLLFIFLN